jgi:putative thiamine transport system permease protein
MALIYLPVFPAIALMLAPAFRLACWQALFADPQIWQALAATLISTLLAVGGALLISLTSSPRSGPPAAGGSWRDACRSC